MRYRTRPPGLDLAPFMGLTAVLVPMLLLSAVPVAIVDTTLPAL